MLSDVTIPHLVGHGSGRVHDTHKYKLYVAVKKCFDLSDRLLNCNPSHFTIR